MTDLKVKHNKIKNTGILFELLVRQLTSDVMNGVKNSVAQRLIESYFKSNSELGKEYLLYQALMKYKYSDPIKAEDYLYEVLTAHSQLNKTELKKAKYNLIKEIKNNYDFDKFFAPKINDYKIMASIYKIFKSKSDNESMMPNDIIDSKYTIIEHITKKSVAEQKQEDDDVLSEYKKQTKDLRMLTYKMMIDRFNEKYKNLNLEQKNLIKEYINNISSENSLYKYISQQLPKIKSDLKSLNERIINKAVVIKINEIIKQVDLLNENTELNDNHIVAMLNVYELIKELNITVENWEKNNVIN
jgi:hypothetical protein